MQIKTAIADKTDLSVLVKASTKALANGINRTLEEAQAAEWQSMGTNLTDRRNGFLRRMIKIAPSDRATASRLIGRIQVIGPRGAEDRAMILTRHEAPTGEQSAPVTTAPDTGGGMFFIPTKVLRPEFSAVVPRRFYPQRLGIVGKHGDGTKTFIVTLPHSDVPIGIFQRLKTKGRGGKRTKADAAAPPNDQMLWSFHAHVKLKPRLHFFETVTKTSMDRIAINYQGMLNSPGNS